MLVFAFGCSKKTDSSEWLPAYLESESLEVASPGAGYLKRLSVHRGQSVKAGQALFEIDPTVQELNQAAAVALAEASSERLADAQQGLRPEEINVLLAEQERAKASLSLATKERDRVAMLLAKNAATQAALDLAENAVTQAQQAGQELQAQLRLAQLGAREFQQKALKQESQSTQASLDLAQWQLARTEQSAPVDAIVQNTLYQPGEWVATASPVVLLRPSDLMRVRFFLTSQQLEKLQLGDPIDFRLNHDSTPITAIVERVSDTPEYTPPVIFSREQSAKLVFLVEARLSSDWARKLHPGQPVSVRLPQSKASAPHP